MHKYTYSKHKANISAYDNIISKMHAPFPMNLKSFAGCKNSMQLSELMGALFYICTIGYLHPDHQAKFPILDGWKPGDRLPAECEELLKEKNE